MRTAIVGPVLFAQDDTQLFLGKDFFPWMVLAFGAAMVVGNVLALLRPPSDVDRGSQGERSSGAARQVPLARSMVLIAVGLAAAIWGVASLLGN